MRKLVIPISISAVFVAFAQEQPQVAPDRERALWSTEFQQGRATTAASKNGLMLGLTAWRLRPAQPQETARALVHEGNGLIAERIGANTMLANEDLVRVTIEVARTGYLYIATREVYTNGKFGDTNLVFPSPKMRRGRASVSPGEVVDIPEWNNRTPYLTLRRGRPDQSGEQLFLLLTTSELPGLIVKSEPEKLPPGTLAGWVQRWGTSVRMLDTPDQKGAALSDPERRAAANAERLRPSDPLPQILFRAPATVQDGILATFTLQLKP